jgi:predicted DNA binding CopG/RHH family protein
MTAKTDRIDLSTASVAQLHKMGLKRINTLIPVNLFKKIRITAATEGITQRELINIALERALEGE